MGNVERCVTNVGGNLQTKYTTLQVLLDILKVHVMFVKKIKKYTYFQVDNNRYSHLLSI